MQMPEGCKLDTFSAIMGFLQKFPLELHLLTCGVFLPEIKWGNIQKVLDPPSASFSLLSVLGKATSALVCPLGLHLHGARLG